MMSFSNLGKFRGSIRFILLSGILFVSFTACNSQKSNSKSAEKVQEEKSDFVPIFNGKNLDGWEGVDGHWKVENGELVGFSTEENPLKANTFLIWREGQPSDFELKLDFKISPTGNSGIQYRSEELPDMPLVLKGYQADIDGAHTYTGQNYEERGRGFLAKRGETAVLENGKDPEITGSLGSGDELKEKINDGDWNSLRLVVEGNYMKHYINGVLMSEVTDNDEELRKMKGLLGIQIHTGPPMEVRMKNIELKDLTAR